MTGHRERSRAEQAVRSGQARSWNVVAALRAEPFTPPWAGHKPGHHPYLPRRPPGMR